MTWLRRLLAGCFQHDDIRERDEQGRPLLVCRTCGDRRYMLDTAIVKGPRHEPAAVYGTPLAKAKKVRPAKVREFPRESQR